VTDRLVGITAPTLLIHGGDDPAAGPDRGRELAAAIADSRLEILRGVARDHARGKTAVTALLCEFVLGRSIAR
jgi:pimeloyl-ACP methyl ester carboxylesterase